MKTKILIVVDGGMIQSIGCSHPDVDIIVVDHDNHIDDQNGFINQYQPDFITSEFWTRYNDESDPVEMEIKDELKRLKF